MVGTQIGLNVSVVMPGALINPFGAMQWLHEFIHGPDGDGCNHYLFGCCHLDVVFR